MNYWAGIAIINDMDKINDLCKETLNEFLDRWPITSVSKLRLNQYVSVGNRDTFCQWLETRTRILGSIKGLNSSKFGIYKRRNSKFKPKLLLNDNSYSWRKCYGNNRNRAFKNILREILDVIRDSEAGKFDNIESYHLTSIVKWKIAYLYSNERLVPIFKKEVLRSIVRDFGINVDKHTPVSLMQQEIISRKPAHLSIYEYGDILFNKYKQQKERSSETKSRQKHLNRRAVQSKNTKPQKRRGSASYIALQRHNILQEKLRNRLVRKYGSSNVKLEENNVDVKLIQPNYIRLYEVKSSAYASDCVKDALGQLLAYSHMVKTKKQIQIVIVGQYLPNDSDKEYISYIQKYLCIPFKYETI